MLNPSLYIAIGDVDLPQNTKDGAFTLRIVQDQDLANQIRMAKAHMQKAAIGFNTLLGANVYVLANAHCPLAKTLAVTLGHQIHGIFSEDFVSYTLVLGVFMDESNHFSTDEYQRHNGQTYAFLDALASHSPYHCVFLLSNRDEGGYVTDHSNGHQFLAHLPLVQDTCFYHHMSLKTVEGGKTLFASGGLGSLDAPSIENAQNQTLQQLAHVLAQSLAGQEGGHLDMPQYTPPKDIVSTIPAVAARPVRPLALRGLTLAEAEDLLFGDNAKTFYHHTYGQDPTLYQGANTAPLHQLAQERIALKKSLDALGVDIAHTTQQVEAMENQRISLINFKGVGRLSMFSPVDNAKTHIGQLYALRHQLAWQKKQHHALTERCAVLGDYCHYVEALVEGLKALPVLPPPTATVEAVAQRTLVNISLLRDDGLVHEQHVLDPGDSPIVLRLVGGFQLEDLVRHKTLAECGNAH